jgi:hypothetical protein
MRNAALPDISRYNNIFPAGHANSVIFFISVSSIPVSDVVFLMEELHADSIDGGHEASYGLGHVPGRGRTPTISRVWP